MTPPPPPRKTPSSPDFDVVEPTGADKGRRHIAEKLAAGGKGPPPARPFKLDEDVHPLANALNAIWLRVETMYTELWGSVDAARDDIRSLEKKVRDNSDADARRHESLLKIITSNHEEVRTALGIIDARDEHRRKQIFALTPREKKVGLATGITGILSVAIPWALRHYKEILDFLSHFWSQ